MTHVKRLICFNVAALVAGASLLVGADWLTYGGDSQRDYA